MFDFRYHALSLVAVFLALGIGIVLGSSLGDSLVSAANRDVRGSLQNDVIQARESARTAAAAVEHRDDFISASFDRLAGNSLRGRRVAIVASGGLPQEIEADVRGAVADAGGTIDSVSRMDAAPDLPDLGNKLGGRFAALGSAGADLRPLSRRFAQALVHGGAIGRKLKAAYPDQFAGDFKGADAVVYYRAGIDRDAQSQRFESALVEGVRASGGPAVGVEAASTDPSQIPFYDNAGLSTVDNVDQPAGHAALALALAGARGNFGFKDTADAPLPAAASPGGG
ncbi:MAG: hypothetical protein QOG63_1791 [Thermoleophilaceae bacterium]|nr:hypothetical protein [Thermoleophilaceae bacterium]